MEVLDEHGHYGAVVRFTPAEWEAFQKFTDRAGSIDEDAEVL